MKGSLAAMLRALVLPYGATTGRRIVLDGVNGVINVYNTAGNVVATIDANGIKSTGNDGSALKMEPGGAAQLLLTPPTVPGVTWDDARIQTTEDGTAEHIPKMSVYSPSNLATPGRSAIRMYGSGVTRTTAFIQVAADTTSFITSVGADGILVVHGADGRVSVLVNNVEETWHNAALVNGWTVSGSSNGMRYRKVASPPRSGELRGVITSPNPFNQIMFNVPAPYRPVAQQMVWAWAGNGSGQLVQIRPSGDVLGFGSTTVATDWWIAGTYPLD